MPRASSDASGKSQNERPPLSSRRIAPPPGSLPTQGEIAEEMAALGLTLPFTIQFGKSTQKEVKDMRGFNDCGLHVLFSVDGDLLETYWNRQADRDGWRRTLEMLRDQLAHTDDADAITYGGITEAYLERLIRIRNLDPNPLAWQSTPYTDPTKFPNDLNRKRCHSREGGNPCGLYHFVCAPWIPAPRLKHSRASFAGKTGVPRGCPIYLWDSYYASADEAAANDAVAGQILAENHQQGVAFALLVPHSPFAPDNSVTIGGAVIADNYFVTLTPAYHPDENEPPIPDPTSGSGYPPTRSSPAERFSSRPARSPKGSPASSIASSARATHPSAGGAL